MKQTTNALILHRNILMNNLYLLMYQCMNQLLNDAEYDMRNYTDRGECYLPDINRLQDLYTTSHHTKSESDQ